MLHLSMLKTLISCLIFPVLLSCDSAPEQTAVIESTPPPVVDTVVSDTQRVDTSGSIRVHDTDAASLVEYSKTLKGICYKYASTDPKKGFDCSGFITYVFNHFNITVPRTSVDFTNEGTPVDLQSAKPGDLILFTGTDTTIRTVGHMGIITYSGDSVVFIHSTSGKAYGVTETTLNPYYMGRFVKVIRVFND